MPAPSGGRGIKTAPEKGSVWCGRLVPIPIRKPLILNVMARWVVLSGFILFFLKVSTKLCFFAVTVCFVVVDTIVGV